MRGVQVRAFTANDLPAAAEALAARHRRHRAAEPLLGADFEAPEVALAHLRRVWGDGISGSVAVSGGRLAGYLLAGAKAAVTWGDNAWVESAEHALDDGVGAEVARELYAHAAAGWVEDGRTAHYVLVPAHDAELVDAWWRLGFGLQHVHALREPWSPAEAAAAAARGSAPSVRVPTRADIAALAELDLGLPVHHGRSPVFASGPAESYEDTVADWEGDFDGDGYRSDRYATVVADNDGQVVGSAVGCALAVSRMYAGPLLTPDAGFLGFAAVRPDSRGRGVGRALGEAVLAWSARRGHPAVVTDWRAANLQSSRAWPTLGFRPTFYRLHRTVGH